MSYGSFFESFNQSSVSLTEKGFDRVYEVKKQMAVAMLNTPLNVK